MADVGGSRYIHCRTRKKKPFLESENVWLQGLSSMTHCYAPLKASAHILSKSSASQKFNIRNSSLWDTFQIQTTAELNTKLKSDRAILPVISGFDKVPFFFWRHLNRRCLVVNKSYAWFLKAACQLSMNITCEVCIFAALFPNHRWLDTWEGMHFSTFFSRRQLNRPQVWSLKFELCLWIF